MQKLVFSSYITWAFAFVLFYPIIIGIGVCRCIYEGWKRAEEEWQDFCNNDLKGINIKYSTYKGTYERLKNEGRPKN